MFARTREKRTTLVLALCGITIGIVLALTRSLPKSRKEVSALTAIETQAGREERVTGAPLGDKSATSAPRETRAENPTVPSHAYDGAAGSGAVQPVLETDPTAPHYDAAKVASVMDNVGYDELFAREPVDPTWAAPMQQRIETLAEKDLLAGEIDGQIDSVQCRTQICRVVISGADSNSLSKAWRMFSISNPAPVRAPGGRNGLTVVVYAVFPPKTRSLQANRELYPRMRAAMLEGTRRIHRQHAGELPPDVPSLLPEQ